MVPWSSLKKSKTAGLTSPPFSTKSASLSIPTSSALPVIHQHALPWKDSPTLLESINKLSLHPKGSSVKCINTTARKKRAWRIPPKDLPSPTISSYTDRRTRKRKKTGRQKSRNHRPPLSGYQSLEGQKVARRARLDSRLTRLFCEIYQERPNCGRCFGVEECWWRTKGEGRWLLSWTALRRKMHTTTTEPHNGQQINIKRHPKFKSSKMHSAPLRTSSSTSRQKLKTSTLGNNSSN